MQLTYVNMLFKFQKKGKKKRMKANFKNEKYPEVSRSTELWSKAELNDALQNIFHHFLVVYAILPTSILSNTLTHNLSKKFWNSLFCICQFLKNHTFPPMFIMDPHSADTVSKWQWWKTEAESESKNICLLYSLLTSPAYWDSLKCTKLFNFATLTAIQWQAEILSEIMKRCFLNLLLIAKGPITFLLLFSCNCY